ncbi:Alpha/Beta hydrolase protein [Amylostereum chailletii]|nr:Alpha/Beta hydrolase protein [Amylostereum chailletii]
MSTESPFMISIPDVKITALKRKLAEAEFPDELEDAGWDYGVPLADVKRLVARWKDGYDWRAAEKELNDTLPQFTRDIDVEGFGTLNVHYVHKKGDAVDAIPLLFVHGWPGSFIEVKKILPLLTSSTPDHPSFTVVALGLPGFGFSEAPRTKGFNPIQFAEVGHKLMLALGYSEYVTQGGDWGYRITRIIASLYGPKHAKAWHTNYPVASPPGFLDHPKEYLTHLFSRYTEKETAGFARTQWFQDVGRGYLVEQSTQPQTLGYGITDSPVGLLAWIYEKLVNWTDGYKWDDDEVLTWISIYWFSRAGPAASLRIYYENRLAFSKQAALRPTVPLGVSHYPKELRVVPKIWACTIGNVVYQGEHDHGGHFAAHEQPESLVEDLREMYRKGGPTFAVVPGKTGYN